MMTIKRMTFVGGAALFLALGAPGIFSPQRAQAQDVAGTVELTRASIQKDRRAIVTKYLKLTNAEGSKFWPLYKEYQSKTAKENDRTLKMMGDLLTADDLKDEELIKALDAYSKSEKNKIYVRQEYVKKFAKVVPARKVFRWFQLENKMDAVIANDLAGAVPLIEH